MKRQKKPMKKPRAAQNEAVLATKAANSQNVTIEQHDNSGVRPFSLPKELSGSLSSNGQIAMAQVKLWQGQFPSPEAIEQYERASPGSFDRIITMAEKAQEAAIEAGREARRFQQKDVQRGHWLGAVVAILAITGAVICAYLNQPLVAGALVAVPVMSVAKALIDTVKLPAISKIHTPISQSGAADRNKK